MALLSAPGVSSEEVLSNRPVIIAPPRIEISPASERSGNPPVTQPSSLRLAFGRGSMRLTSQTRNALRGLRGAKGVLRITGYGDAARPDEKLANLRARAVASYLEEYSGIYRIEILWQAEASAEPGIGATIEEKP